MQQVTLLKNCDVIILLYVFYFIDTVINHAFMHEISEFEIPKPRIYVWIVKMTDV